jgi:predicted amidohydrolase
MNKTSSPTLQVSCVQLHWAKPIEYNLEKTLEYIQRAASENSRVVVFPETNLTGYYFPYVTSLSARQITEALRITCEAAARANIWVIAGTLRKHSGRYLNLAHVINPEGKITHEYAKLHLAGVDEKRYCRAGDKLSLFQIDGIWCTLAICRDGRHPEVYRIPAMAGAQILFQPSCSSDDTEAVTWKRTSGRAQLPVGPSTHIFHCVANTIGQTPDGQQTSSGASFIRQPNGLPLAEAGFYQEEMITAVLKLDQADRSYLLESMVQPPFLRKYWKEMVHELKNSCDTNPV